MAKTVKNKAKEEKPKKEIVIEETEDDIVLANGFTGNSEELKDVIKKEAERGHKVSRFLVPFVTFILFATLGTLVTWYYAKPEHSAVEVQSAEDKIETPPVVKEEAKTPAVQVPTPSQPTTSPAAPATAEKKEVSYTIKAGDTLSSIANAHDMTSKQLADYNGITDVNSLKIGQVIKIPQ